MIALRCALLLILAAAIAPTRAHAAKAGEESRESKVLEATTIEGQILFPKVLFISVEDQARYPETLHRSYLRSAFEIAHSAPLPKTICAPEPEDATPPATDGSIPSASALPGTTNANISTNPQEVNP
ncbi:MAG TPA: hypothetical protein VFR10_09785 [bacterium]|nr:hypothetical protein [bacterium]